MCGLVGLISRKSFGFSGGDLDIMQNLLILDQIRGEDSTGVFSIFRDRSASITKVGSHPMHLFSTGSWMKHRQKAIANGRIIIGHNRKATAGKISSENAHPFQEENIILVHNGTLRGGHKKLADVEVDSHAVCHSFAQNGAEETLKTLDAAFAFIWWDVEKEKLFAVRNDERPLHIVMSDDLLVLCSEPWMAQAILSRAHKKVEQTITIPPGVLYEFDLNGEYTSKTVEIKKYTAANDNYGQYSQRYDHWRESRRAALEEAFDDDLPDTLPGKPVGTAAAVKDAIHTPFKEVSCALVQNQGKTTTEEDPTPFVRNEHFEKGEEVLLKIFNVIAEPAKHRSRLTGSVVVPGKPRTDFVGFLSDVNSTDYIKGLMKGVCTGNIIGFTKSSCGDGIFVKNIRQSEMIKTLKDNLPAITWQHVVKNEKCKDCGKPIHSCEAEFTSVTENKTDTFRVTCADCVEDNLPKGELQNDFVQRRLTSLQAGLVERPEPAKGTLHLVKQESVPTIH